MNAEKAADNLRVIRELMERPIRYSTMSGLSGIWAGAVTVGGCLADALALRVLPTRDALLVSIGIWGAVLALALGGTILLTRRREKQRNMPAWSPVKRRILLTITPPFLAAIGLTAVIVGRFWIIGGWWELIPAYLIPPIWMLFYGVTLWQLGDLAPIEVRILGAAFIAAGLLAAAMFQFQPYLTMGVTFGGFHMVYGLAVWVRHGG